jgi:chromosome segregation ATPase
VTPVGDLTVQPGEEPSHPVATKCGHLFHSTCLEKWLKQKSICPCCKKKLMRRNDVFRLYTDEVASAASAEAHEAAGAAGAGAGAVSAAELQPLLAHATRKCGKLEAELETARKDAEQAERRKGLAEAEVTRKDAEIQRLRKEVDDERLLHNHDHDVAHRSKQALERLRREHEALQAAHDSAQTDRAGRQRAERVANGEAEYDPLVDKPEVLKWSNEQLRRQKEEFKRQVAELSSRVEKKQAALELSDGRAARRKARLDNVRRSSKTKGGGGGVAD